MTTINVLPDLGDNVFRLHIHTDNAAFADDPATEVARVLRVVADKLDRGQDFSKYQTIMDANGNDVGRAKLEA